LVLSTVIYVFSSKLQTSEIDEIQSKFTKNFLLLLYYFYANLVLQLTMNQTNIYFLYIGD